MLKEKKLKFIYEFSNSLLQQKIISQDEDEVVQFGLECLMGDMVGMFLTLAIGLCFKQVGIALIFWICLYPVRINCGGYHASTRERCLLITTIMIAGVFYMINLCELRIVIALIEIHALWLIIWTLSPMDNEIKRLDLVEKLVYRRRTRTTIIVELLLFYLSLLLGWTSICRGILMAFCVASTSLILGMLNNMSRKKN